jgi:hypothetical protein
MPKPFFIAMYTFPHSAKKNYVFKNLEQGLLPYYSLGNPFSFFCHLPF